MSSARPLTVQSSYTRVEALGERALSALRLFRQVCLRAHRAWSGARARDELRALSDRTLKDIGLSRAEIDALFR